MLGLFGDVPKILNGICNQLTVVVSNVSGNQLRATVCWLGLRLDYNVIRTNKICIDVCNFFFSRPPTISYCE